VYGGIALHKEVFHSDLPNLAFVGLGVTSGAHPPVAEIQSHWVARVFAGHLHLPSNAEMVRVIEKDRLHLAHQSPLKPRSDAREALSSIPDR